MDLSGNQFASIGLSAFRGLKHLQNLDLSYNKLSKVTVDMFNQKEASTASATVVSKSVTAIPNLKKLNLLGNMIATVETGALDGLVHCQSINLGENKIETFTPGTFTNLNFVKTLLLAGNRIGAVDAGMFKGLTEIQTLDLSYNKIRTVFSKPFLETVHLKTLILSGNEIPSIFAIALDGLNHLQTLDLSYNQIKTPLKNGFDGMPHLQHLKLQGNNVETLFDDMLDGIEHLQSLDLSENKLRYIGENTFKVLPNLRSLSLEANNIVAVNAKAFAPMKFLAALYLDNNPFTCNPPSANSSTAQVRVPGAALELDACADALSCDAECAASPVSCEACKFGTTEVEYCNKFPTIEGCQCHSANGECQCSGEALDHNQQCMDKGQCRPSFIVGGLAGLFAPKPPTLDDTGGNSKTCKATFPTTTDAWCNVMCNKVPAYCPANHCECSQYTQQGRMDWYNRGCKVKTAPYTSSAATPTSPANYTFLDPAPSDTQKYLVGLSDYTVEKCAEHCDDEVRCSHFTMEGGNFCVIWAEGKCNVAPPAGPVDPDTLIGTETMCCQQPGFKPIVLAGCKGTKKPVDELCCDTNNKHSKSAKACPLVDGAAPVDPASACADAPFGKKNLRTCWGDSAYQRCPKNRQGAYELVQAAVPKGGDLAKARAVYEALLADGFMGKVACNKDIPFNVGGCAGTRHGCCEDKETSKKDMRGSNCISKPTKPDIICCKAVTADCLSCAAGVTVAAFCDLKESKGVAGCEPIKPPIKPPTPPIADGTLRPPSDLPMVGGCAGTRHGCCEDTMTSKMDKVGSNCMRKPIKPPPTKVSYKYPTDTNQKCDGEEYAKERYKFCCVENYGKGCVNIPVVFKLPIKPFLPPMVGGCAGTQHGCCDDKSTSKSDTAGSNCDAAKADFCEGYAALSGEQKAGDDGWDAKQCNQKLEGKWIAHNGLQPAMGNCADAPAKNWCKATCRQRCDKKLPIKLPIKVDPPTVGGCAGTRHGCCDGKSTSKSDKEGTNCDAAVAAAPKVVKTLAPKIDFKKRRALSDKDALAALNSLSGH